MARSDLILSLVRGAQRQDQSLIRRSVDAIIAEERAKQHNILADQLEEAMRSSAFRAGPTATVPADERLHESLHQRDPRLKLDDLVLPPVVRTACDELIEEHHRADLLRSYGLEPRNRVLLAGPPGNGKTSVAEAIASALMVPLLVVRYEGVIGSFLGETAARLHRVFEHARTRRCLLFFDEFDTVGKERGDVHETGEIKRVVSSLLLQIDDMPSHVVVVTATNHPELLDRAAWRRFQLRIVLPPPTRVDVIAWLQRFETRLGHSLGFQPESIARRLGALSFAELEEFGADIRRRFVLSLPNADVRRIVGSRLRQWEARGASVRGKRAGTEAED